MSTEAKRETVLVIENDLHVARHIVMQCFAMGHLPLVARDGFTGLLLARKILPRLILSDVSVPGLDGFEIVRRVRQIHDLDHTCVVAISSRIPSRAVEHQNNFDDCVLKPINTRRLEHVLERCFATSALKGQA